MNALNGNIQRAVSPLVAEVGKGQYLWVQDGFGFLLHATAGAWHPITHAFHGGKVLNESQVVALVAAYGRPL